MVPEYASEGLFSIKSDVFSFGVLTLEIISGKRTSSSHQYGEFINLLGYVSFFQYLNATCKVFVVEILILRGHKTFSNIHFLMCQLIFKLVVCIPG